MRKLLAFLLIACMIISMAGCYEEDVTVPTTTEPTTEPTEPPVLTYTYRDYVTASPTVWNPLSWQTEGDGYIVNNTTMGLYDTVLNATGDGYAFVAEMAAGDPVDVTAEYAGSQVYGVPAGAWAGYAYRIDLNRDAVWEDGTAINADTYVQSMMLLLDPAAKNLRASAYFDGTLSIAHAYDYYHQEKAGTLTCISLEEAGYASIEEAQADGHQEFYLDMKEFWDMDCGWLNINDETMYRDASIEEGKKEDYVSAKYLYDQYLKDGKSFSAFRSSFIGICTERVDAVTWDNVGIVKTGEYQITLILDAPISETALKYGLSSNWIVPAALYDSDYGTAAGEYLSYGPYRLESVSAGEMTLVRNESWYGYTDGQHEGQFTVPTVYCRVIPDQAKALSAFENGQLDRVDASNYEQVEASYASQVFTYSLSYTSKLTLNSDYEALRQRQSAGINKTILSYVDFRHAISLCISRKSFVDKVNSIHEPGYGLLNDTYITDLATGESYRDTSYGQAVMWNVYGQLDVINQARNLFLQAYNAALSAGVIWETDVIALDFVAYSDEAVYKTIASSIQSSIDAAIADTVLEGRVQINLVADADYYTRARKGSFDIILSTLGGSTTDPWGMMGYYCDPELLFEYGFDPETATLDIAFGDTVLTKTYYNWYWTLCTGVFAQADAWVRNTILAAMEQGLLSQYCAIPIYSRNAVTLYSDRIGLAMEQDVNLLSIGDLRYVTILRDDAAWDENF